jgi:monofunctional biosynthetic peptidoglycan transglycosylase
MPRSSPSTQRASAVDSFIDIEAFSFAATSAALLTARTAPFGHSPVDRVLGFIANYWSGSPRFRMVVARRSRLVRYAFATVRAVIAVHLFFILSTAFLLVIFKTVNPAATTLMLYRHIDSGWKIVKPRYLPLSKIPKSTRNMAVRVEDGNFYEHHGIMLAAIKNAYQLNKRFGEPIYGGSTITMQTARTIFLVPAKSYLRKYLELIIALEMEVILGKQRILELYFNYAEWGKGVFGIEAASHHHYKAGVASLSRDQAIRLVTLLSSPIRYGPYGFGRNGILKSRYAYLDKRFGSGASSDLPPPPTVLPAENGNSISPSEESVDGTAASGFNETAETKNGPPNLGDDAVPVLETAPGAADTSSESAVTPIAPVSEADPIPAS